MGQLSALQQLTSATRTAGENPKLLWFQGWRQWGWTGSGLTEFPPSWEGGNLDIRKTSDICPGQAGPGKAKHTEEHLKSPSHRVIFGLRSTSTAPRPIPLRADYIKSLAAKVASSYLILLWLSKVFFGISIVLLEQEKSSLLLWMMEKWP